MSLKILLNAEDFTPASRIFIFDLYKKLKRKRIKADLNKFHDYDKYDYLFLMGYDKNFKKIRIKNPDVKIVLCEPKQSSKEYIDNVTLADLVIVCSNEHRDSFLRLNQNIIVYPTYPLVNSILKKHLKKESLTIGYHGNKVHIEAMHDNIINSIESVSQNRKISLNLIYNIAQVGIVKKNLPRINRNLTINHIQWHQTTFEREMKKIDIGIVPSLLPIKNPHKVKNNSMVKNLDVNYEPFDYLLRYKSTNNSGRISIFAKYGIPVIAEPTQSNCEVINNGENGYICYSLDNWTYTLNLLCEDYKLRNKISKNLINDIKKIEKYSFENLISKLKKFDAIKSNNTKGYNDAIKDLKKYKYQKNYSLIYKYYVLLTKFKMKMQNYINRL